MSKKFLVIGILCILIIGGGFFYTHNKALAPSESSGEAFEKELDAAKNEIQTASENVIYTAIDDKEFVQFAQTKIESKCPFYVPDGVTYRQCLTDWVEALQMNVDNADQMTIGKECEAFVSRNSEPASLEAGDLYAKCLVYRLSTLKP